jgi:nucleoid-associated protein YgaU
MLARKQVVNSLRKLVIGCLIASSAMVLTGGIKNNHANYELVQDVYTVERGDTLWSIADQYMKKNTYGPRDIREFISGIVELNYDDVFKSRDGNHYIYPNDKLKINYWIERKDDK